MKVRHNNKLAKDTLFLVLEPIYKALEVHRKLLKTSVLHVCVYGISHTTDRNRAVAKLIRATSATYEAALI